MREGLFDAKLPEVGENEVPLGPLAIFPVPFLLRTPGILSHILISLLTVFRWHRITISSSVSRCLYSSILFSYLKNKREGVLIYILRFCSESSE